MKKLIVLIFILGILVLASPIPTPTPGFQPIVKSQGDVTISAKPLTLSVEALPSFEIIMDTHNVLLDFDMTAVASLTDTEKKTYGKPVWQGTKPGGHHQKGTLTFPVLLTNRPEKMELTFRDIDGVSIRNFVFSAL